MFGMLTRRGIEVAGYVDRNAYDGQTLLGVPVFKPSAPCIEYELPLIVSIVMTKENRESLFRALKQAGHARIIDGQSIRASEVPFDKNSYECGRGHHTERIHAAKKLLCDAHSVEIFERNVAAHMRRDYSDCVESVNCRQYFPEDVPLTKGYGRFVDCGAYTGDTLRELLNNIGDVDTYIGFEPETELFAMLSAVAAKSRRRLKQLFLFPCAVGSDHRMTSITGDYGSGVTADGGGAAAQMIRLDDALTAFEPTMIKMDIEGAERDALCGAKNLIRRAKPDLAVCVYHYVSDYWEIPLLLAELNPGYSFYMRTHSSCSMETVLYATEIGGSLCQNRFVSHL
jgi:FkbM family methyltransferase